jgi:cytochrome c oxidase assembly factor CtaG
MVATGDDVLAAPLLALGAPGLPFLLALPHGWRRRVAVLRNSAPGRRVRAVVVSPVFAFVVFTVVVVAWHLPAVYTAALEDDVVHEAEHACFLLAAWLLWVPLAAPDRSLDGGRGVLYVFVGGFPMIGVGAALVMAPWPLYPAQTGTGPGALAAQQMAGVLMWVPPTFLALFVVAALVLFWFRGMERTSPGDAPLPPAIPPDLGVAREEVAG